MSEDPAYQGDRLRQVIEEQKPEIQKKLRLKTTPPKSIIHGKPKLSDKHYEIVALWDIHYQAIELIRKGDMTKIEIAKQLGVSKKTLWVWEQSHVFREELIRQKEEALDRIYSREIDYAADALDVLHKIMTSPRVKNDTRVRAAREVLLRRPPNYQSSLQVNVTPASKVNDMSQTPDDRLTELFQDTEDESTEETEPLNETPL